MDNNRLNLFLEHADPHLLTWMNKSDQTLNAAADRVVFAGK
jgi:succinate dehydrogenase flavin-adding protein (antitoxin of CptAB toxin-antitoxin module)